MALPLKIKKKRPERYFITSEIVCYYQSYGRNKFWRFSKKTSEQCTVTRADCYAVLIALEENIKDALSFGQIVRFGTIGSFQISISSHGSETKEAVGISAVKSNHILFRPD